jgi:Mrp family chromosome partitioning ATPase
MINTEIRRIVDELTAKEKVANNRVQQLETQISDLQETLRRRGLAEIRLRELERDLLADQKLNDLVVARLGGLDPFAEIAKPSARVVSVAEIPTEPSFPQRGRIFGGGVIGATVLAIIVALMLEASDIRIRSGERIAKVAQLRNLASVPKVRASRLGRRVHVLKQLLLRPRSTSSEAYRSLLLACRAQITQTKAVILVAAPLPGDGTTSVAFGLAFSAARDGVKTLYIVVDPQAPRPSTPVIRQRESSPGSDVETSTPPSDGIRPVPGIDLLETLTTSGPRNGRQAQPAIDLRLLLEKLRRSYDLIVIDVAPVLILEDANWLSPFVDAVLLVVRFGRTTERELMSAVSRLNINRAPLIGTVLNGVDPRGGIEEPLGAESYPAQAKTYFAN